MTDVIRKQYSQLTAATTPTDTDLIAIYQGASPLKVITWANFLEAIVAELGVLVDSEGNPFNPDSYDKVCDYVDGNLSTITITDGVKTWVKTYTYNATFTYNGGGVATESNWVVQ